MENPCKTLTITVIHSIAVLVQGLVCMLSTCLSSPYSCWSYLITPIKEQNHEKRTTIRNCEQNPSNKVQQGSSMYQEPFIFSFCVINFAQQPCATSTGISLRCLNNNSFLSHMFCSILVGAAISLEEPRPTWPHLTRPSLLGKQLGLPGLNDKCSHPRSTPQGEFLGAT